MLNLHAPFRRAVSSDEAGIGNLSGASGSAALSETVVADEGGPLTAMLSGEPDGEAWRITAVAVAAERLNDLGPRILAIADALAAEEGLTAVTIDSRGIGPDMLAILGPGGIPAGSGWGRAGRVTAARPARSSSRLRSSKLGLTRRSPNV
jgi:hypothetical protein